MKTLSLGKLAPASAFLAVFAVTASRAEAANLVVNGDFSANAAAYVTAPGWNGAIPEGAGNPASIENWTSAPANGAVALNGPSTGFGASPFGPATAPEFNFACVKWATQAIYQNLALTPDTTYVVEFDAAAPEGLAGAKFMVQLCDDGTPFWYTGSTPANTNAFAHYTFTVTTPPRFVGTPSIRLVVPTATGNGSDTVLFGNVSVQPGSVSLPPNLVTNGNFYENASDFIAWPGYANVPDSFPTDNPSEISGWSWAKAGLMGVSGTHTGFGATPHSPITPLTCYAFMQWAPGNYIYQDLPLAAGKTYTLEFDAAGLYGVAVPEMFTVELRDGGSPFWTTGSLPCNTNEFAHYTYTFTTPDTFAGTPSIRLINSGSGNVTTDFANVSVRLAPAGPVTLGIERSGANLLLTWSSGQLLEATEVSGPWTTNSGAPSPYLVQPAGKKFYRVLVQ